MEHLCDIRLRTPKTQRRIKTDQWFLINQPTTGPQTKLSKVKRQPPWEESFKNHISEDGLDKQFIIK